MNAKYTEILKIYVQKLKYFNYSPRTIEIYSHYAGKFLEKIDKYPQHIVASDFSDYLLNFPFSSISQQNQVINAVKFLYEKVLNKKYAKVDFTRPRREVWVLHFCIGCTALFFEVIFLKQTLQKKQAINACFLCLPIIKPKFSRRKMEPEHQKLAAELNDLLSYADPEHYSSVLTDLWEGWLTSPESTAADHRQRAEKLEVYKRLLSLINSLPGR